MGDDQTTVDVEAAPDAQAVEDISEAELLDADGTPEGEVAPEWSSWRHLWQVPTLILSTALIAVGFYVAAGRAPENDFDAAFDQTESLLAKGDFENAGEMMRNVIEPNLDDAAPGQVGRYHAIAADWIHQRLQVEAREEPAQLRRIAQHYDKAVELGFWLEPPRTERWAATLVELGEIDDARRRLTDLEALAESSGEQEAKDRRNRILRMIVEQSLNQPDLPYQKTLELLGEYRADRMLSAADEAWAVSRQAELRLEAGLPQAAIDRLLIDMRRLEQRPGFDPQNGLSELYTLLGRGYYELGQYPDAEFHLDLALGASADSSAAKGDALVMLGRIEMARSAFDDAFLRFDDVVRNYIGTRSHMPGLLGRAEVYGVIGEHDDSLSDYERLRGILPTAGPRRDVTREVIGDSLVARHDAAIALGNLGTALDYALLAERFFETSSVPVEILFRVASTSSQIAHDLISEVLAGRDESALEPGELDAGVRFEANKNYERAGDYYVRHAEAIEPLPGEDQAWADSFWNGADNFDLGGWNDRAIAHFRRYTERRSDADARRLEAVYRLARCHHAALDFDEAIKLYRQVIENNPSSALGTASHVPLARCLIATDAPEEAVAQLRQVLDGRFPIEPAAPDYRDAQIEIGKLHYQQGQFTDAIQELTKAIEYYPQDRSLPETLFYLADSYLARAQEMQEQVDDVATPRADSANLARTRLEFLGRAEERFRGTRALLDGPRDVPLNRLQDSLLRLAYLKEADCAFHLGPTDSTKYEDAIKLYDQVARRYSKHASSMNALVQIINCYWELGDYDSAQTAGRRAQLRLSQLPDEAFDDAGALLNREAWQRWLRNMPIGSERAAVDAE